MESKTNWEESLKKQMAESSEKSEKLGILKERTRIMLALEAAGFNSDSGLGELMLNEWKKDLLEIVNPKE